MSDALEGMKARLSAAEPGPWFLDLDGVSIYYVFHNGDTMDRDRLAESSGADAEFIAHAPTDMARLIKAMEAVEALADEIAEGASHSLLNKVIARSIRGALAEALGGE